MHNNKEILKHCPNFEHIINTDFLERDSISLKLVELYKDFIFKIDLNNYEDINRVNFLDKAMGKYIDDYTFRKNMQTDLAKVRIKKSTQDPLRAIIDSIISIYKRYEEDSTRKIYISKWI